MAVLYCQPFRNFTCTSVFARVMIKLARPKRFHKLSITYRVSYLEYLYEHKSQKCFSTLVWRWFSSP